MPADGDHDCADGLSITLSRESTSLIADLAERFHVSHTAVVERAVQLLAEMEKVQTYEVRPIAPQGADPGQAWFWTPEWQAREREADADIAAGRTTIHASDDEFFAALAARRPDVADA